MTEEVIVHLFSNVGVPAVLCFYTIVEVNKNIKKLTEAVDRLEQRIERLENKIFLRNEGAS